MGGIMFGNKPGEQNRMEDVSGGKVNCMKCKNIRICIMWIDIYKEIRVFRDVDELPKLGVIDYCPQFNHTIKP